MATDTERLDWLIAHNHMHISGNNERGWMIMDQSEGLTFVVRNATTSRYAIDVAMDKEKKA